MGKYCPKCNSEVSETAKFCRKCGCNLKENQSENVTTFCPECGTKCDANDLFCPECGTSLKEETFAKDDFDTNFWTETTSDNDGWGDTVNNFTAFEEGEQFADFDYDKNKRGSCLSHASR